MSQPDDKSTAAEAAAEVLAAEGVDPASLNWSTLEANEAGGSVAKSERSRRTFP